LQSRDGKETRDEAENARVLQNAELEFRAKIFKPGPSWWSKGEFSTLEWKQMIEIQAVFEQCRMEQYLFSFGLFSVWGALFHWEPIECQELKERRKALDGGSS